MAVGFFIRIVNAFADRDGQRLRRGIVVRGHGAVKIRVADIAIFIILRHTVADEIYPELVFRKFSA